METIRWERDGRVGIITLDRPGHRNGITGTMMRELHETVTAAAADDDLLVVVLTGAGSSFCVGADLKHYSSGAATEPTPPEQFELTVLLHEMPAVTVAAINGAAAGAGLGWAMACDFRVATRSAVFNTAFLDVAVAGDMGLPWSLPRLVGAAKARELSFLPGKLTADEALAMGLVGAVHDDGAFETGWRALVDRLAASAPLALQGMKQNYLDAERMTFGDYISVETERHGRITASADTTEAFLAFVEKRAPVFEGR
jgi:2-(1,2-epoxy-1,2-dihydrophenyl)acetyl-CoA isomerase